jgi:phosphoglycerate dehydrogenase-like enzyme
MAKKIVILWNRSELTGTRTDEDPRVPELRNNAVSRLEALGYDVAATPDADVALEQIPYAEVYYAHQISTEAYAAAENLKWIQTSVAGMEGFWYPQIRESDTVITSVRGIYSDVIADHMYGLLLAFSRGIQTYAKRQSLKTWAKNVARVTQLSRSTLGLVGLGGIGLAVAARANASGMRIIAVDPAPKGSPDYVETVYPPEQLDELLRQSDFVAVSVPYLSETEHMFDEHAFSTMKDSAYIFNVGRGKVISLDALTEALREGKIAGAGLDVFEEEPLPDNHPLWEMDNVLITPHVAGRSDYPYQEEGRLNVLVENAERYLKGEDLRNIFDKQKGYVV